jgi:hypothetical protein
LHGGGQPNNAAPDDCEIKHFSSFPRKVLVGPGTHMFLRMQEKR